MLVSTAERDQAIARLGDEAVAGRLTVDELEARVGAALRARTRRDLNRTQRGLPRDRSLPHLAIRIAVLVVTILWLVTILLVCALVALARHLHAHRPARRHALPRA